MRDYLAAFERSEVPRLYLAATSIPDSFPMLVADIATPFPDIEDLACEPRLFVGAAGSKTSLHCDFPNNVHAVIQGHKRVTMVDRKQSALLYRDPMFASRPNYSNVDVDAPDYARHPRFRNVDTYVVDIHGGEILFIPSYWWHRGHTIERSISVTYWWGGKKLCPQYVRQFVPLYIRTFSSRVTDKLGIAPRPQKGSAGHVPRPAAGRRAQKARR